MLFDGSAMELVRLLAVPVQPQNPPENPPETASTPAQTRNGRCITTRMASHSAAKDMDGMKKRPKRKADSEVNSSSQYHKEAKTKDGDNRADTDNYSVIGHHSVIDRPVTFSTLPPEVHRLIFTCIECIEDVFRLGLANRYFWSIGRERMHDYYASFLGRWASENIVCVGEDGKPGDYPPGLFSAEELDVLRQKTSDIPYDWDDDD
ncbi:hypothetical protein B0T26DRAFT_735654 [Lasiosphaeria miniovina]|uniref:F-box domain-containing protein n=1 Tax=Lasiosphaeria miniovina TaxID=1954250 RepID=A0AA39ZRC3_9PEZI|nr:uncharacterized protein B0T26DRAFT_735654 [Lasiosphaeria miniovina]KAK0702045.1 hypothetical protein B0T26DRAFT_735654 [Lasiosphaeria miniovina]